MTNLSTAEKQALLLFKQHVLTAFPNSVDAIQLFGSKARGDAAKHSDIDILVVLKDMTWKNKRAIRKIASEIIFSTNIVMSIHIFSHQQLDTMKRQHAVFWQMIEPDLKPI